MLSEGCLAQGYAVTKAYDRGEDHAWVCAACFADLRELMDWEIVD